MMLANMPPRCQRCQTRDCNNRNCNSQSDILKRYENVRINSDYFKPIRRTQVQRGYVYRPYIPMFITDVKKDLIHFNTIEG